MIAGEKKWKSILSTGKFEGRLDANEAYAKRLGVTETPTIFVNGVPWSVFDERILISY